MIYLLYGFVILACRSCGGLPVTYDQRQTGNLNVQVNLKDVQVLAVLDSDILDDYTEYDYFYDYADFTIKPPGKPTTKPTATSTIESPTLVNSTESINANEQNSANKTEQGISSEPSNFTNSIDSSTQIPVVSSTTVTIDGSESNETLRTRINDKAEDLIGDEDTSAAKKSENSTMESTLGKSGKEFKKRCKSGYSPNGRGRCRSINRRRFSLVPIAVKLTPQVFGSKVPKD